MCIYSLMHAIYLTCRGAILQRRLADVTWKISPRDMNG